METCKISIIGDSFALPRMWTANYSTIEAIEDSNGKIGISEDEIFPEYLRKKLDLNFEKLSIQISNFSVGGNTSYNGYISGCLNLYMQKSEFLILNLGLVDCWDRPQNVRAPFLHMQNKSPWVSIEEYEKNINNIINFAFDICQTVKHIFIINVPYVSEEQYKKYSNSLKRTQDYNVVLDKIEKTIKKVSLVNIFDFFNNMEKTEVEKYFFYDGIHYNREGQKMIAELIYEKMESIISYFEAEKLYHENEIDEALEYIKKTDKNKLTEEYRHKFERLERICKKKTEKYEGIFL